MTSPRQRYRSLSESYHRKKLRKKSWIVGFIVISFISIFFLTEEKAQAETYYNQAPYSELHRQYGEANGLWGAFLSGNRWVHKDNNDLRSNWHNWMYENNYHKEGWRLVIDAGPDYQAPEGYEIQDFIKYDVHSPRTYPLSIRDCTELTYGWGAGTAQPHQYVRENIGACHPHTFESQKKENEWARIVDFDKWRYDREEPVWEGKTGPYYLFNVAVISGVAYDYRIKPIKKETPEEPWIPPGPGPSCEIMYDISAGGSMNHTPAHMEAHPEGKILASEESDNFDVEVYGIPSSEYLKVKGQSEKYLSNYSYTNMGGNVIYKIKVKKTYVLKWSTITGYDELGNPIYAPQSITEEVEKEIEDPYVVNYWQIGHLNILSFMDATFRNYALPSGEVIVPNFDQVVASSKHSADILAHVFPQECDPIHLGSQEIDGGTTKPDVPEEMEVFIAGAKLTSRPPDVKNDYVNVDGTTSMSEALASLTAPTPSEIPIAPKVEVEERSLLIDPLKVNMWNTHSSITARYETVHMVNSSKMEVEFIGESPDKINTVTVHTPVVIFAKASDDKEHDQRTDGPDRSLPANPDTDRHAFILDRPFTVTLPNYGQHINEPGYGNRDYSKYFKEKQIRFPFDVYTEGKSGFYPKDTWIKVPINMTEVPLFLPVWIPEGEYTIDYRTIAINAPQDHVDNETPKEHEANLNYDFRTADAMMDNHVAYDTIEVDVVGRLYDFRLTDILDYNWGSVFRTTEGLIEHTGNHYWVGDKEIDGEPRSTFEEPFRLPIRHGSHPDGYKNVAVKTGYQFKFDMKTKGDMRNMNDGVHITPSFYFVDKNGQNRQKVDVYYHNDLDYFVKVGSEQDKEYRMVKLNEPLRNVPSSQLANTADYYYRHAEDYEYVTEKNEQFINTFIRNFERTYSKKENATGPYGDQILHWKLRTFIGPLATSVPSNAMVPQADAISSEQQWYGEYSLPADIYIVEEERNIPGYGLKNRLNKSHPIFLRDGYLIVNFDIETIQNGNLSKPHLQYINAELTNQWKREGFQYDFTDSYGFTFPLIDGDVLFYHGDESSLQDFNPNVTH